MHMHHAFHHLRKEEERVAFSNIHEPGGYNINKLGTDKDCLICPNVWYPKQSRHRTALQRLGVGKRVLVKEYELRLDWIHEQHGDYNHSFYILYLDVDRVDLDYSP